MKRAARSLDDYRETFDRLIDAVAVLTEDELNDPSAFAGLPEEIPGCRPWRVLYDPDHYAAHGKAIAEALGAGEQRLLAP